MRCPSHWTWVLLLTRRVRNCLSLRLCEYKYRIPNSSNVHLWAPNPNNTVRNSFGISNKVCYLPSSFWINYWRAWMEKQRQHSLQHLPDLTQQYFSCILAVFLSRNVAHANYSDRKAPSHKMDSVCFLSFFWFADFALWTLGSRHLCCLLITF